MRSFSGSMRGSNTHRVPSTRTARCWTFSFRIALRSPHCAPQPGRLRDEPRQPLGAGCRRSCHVFRPPGQAAISAAAPERLEKVPVLEERPAATGTYKARHSASSPRNRGHPGERNKEKRRVLEKQVVQQISKEKHSRNATEEQVPKSRRPMIQITPCCVERKTGGHTKSTWGCQPRAEHPSVLYCGTQGIQGEPMFAARAPIGSLDAVFCAFPIPALHMRIETDRSLQATPRRNPLVPSVHQAIQRFAGICSRNANCPRLIWTGHERLSISWRPARPTGRRSTR